MLTIVRSHCESQDEQYSDAQNRRVVAGDPMAVFILQIIRNLSLRKVVRSLKCKARVIIASRIIQR